MNLRVSSQPVEHLHPVLDFAHRLVARLDSLADAPLMSAAFPLCWATSR